MIYSRYPLTPLYPPMRMRLIKLTGEVRGAP